MAEGVPATAVAVLAAARPAVVAEWARLAGAPESVFAATNARRLGVREISEAYWATPAIVSAIAGISSRQGEERSETELLEGELAALEYVEGDSVNETIWVRLESGVEGFHKAFTHLDDDTALEYGQDAALQPIHEVSAWLLARELGEPWRGLVPTCVLRPVEGRLGSFSRRVEGDATSPLGTVPPPAIAAAAFFDSLTAQQDRHGGNLLVDGPSLQLIDHGFTFAKPGDYANASMFVSYRHRSGNPRLTAPERKALRRLLDSSDALGLAAVLERDRVDALRSRARRMLQHDAILPQGEY